MGSSRSHGGKWGRALLGFRLESSGEIVGAREMHFYASACDLGVRGWGVLALGSGTDGRCVHGNHRNSGPRTPMQMLACSYSAGGAGGWKGLVRSFGHILKMFPDSPKGPEHCYVARDTHRNTGRQGSQGAARPPEVGASALAFCP